MRHNFFFTLLLFVSLNLAAEQKPSTSYKDGKEAPKQQQKVVQQSRSNSIGGLKASPSGDGRPIDSYPPCDEKFEKACKGAGGTLSKQQGWGGKTCFKSLKDDYCKSATTLRPQFLRGQ